MADEATGYAGAAGLAFAHTVIDQLGDREIAPTPPNYELWATYRTGAFPDLNREMEARIAAGEELTPALCEDLYERFFMPTRSYEQLVQTGESIAHELVGALAHLREANTNAGAFASRLENAASDMEATPEPSHIKQLVRNLVAETREVAARNRALETQMEASSKQMEALQVSVRQATLEAVTDGLTGLANRRHFDRLLSRQVLDAGDRARPLCLIMCDIDHFKRINDSWGHPVGDQVIRYVASAVRAAAPKPACGARYGGEEFALLLPRTDIDDARTIAQELLKRVRARTLSRKSSGELIGHITISAGVAVLKPGESAEALVRRADAALYEAKRAGRDRVICDESETRAAA
jgi:diguanylate cyclase